MKYLGIDYGEKRVGIAISDNDGKVAFPKIVLENDVKLLKKIGDIITDELCVAIVIGESKDYKGEDNKINPAIISFKRSLATVIKLPIYLEPEFMSSMQVEKNFGKTDMLDASAAAIILQTFMDKEAHRQEKKKEITVDEKKSGEKITYDDFKKVEMKVGKILSAEKVPGSEKLLKLSVDFAENAPRQIVSGISAYFPNFEMLVGKKVAFVTNLEARPLMGLMSDGMVLAVKSEDNLALMEVPDFVKEGTILG
jgi:methionine--tRNA ligase beta chain